MTTTAKPATKPTARLRELLVADGLIVAPFILNALHARIAESVGFNAVYMTGAGTSAEKGFPDVGMLTMTEMVTNARYIANAVTFPSSATPIRATATLSPRSARCASTRRRAWPESTSRTRCFPRSAAFSRASRWCRWRNTSRKSAPPWTRAATRTLLSSPAATPTP